MDKICISGASYGGYAAMHAATKMPGMFKCIISYVGVYDLTSKDLRGLQWSEIGQAMEWIEKGDPDIITAFQLPRNASSLSTFGFHLVLHLIAMLSWKQRSLFGF